MGYEKRQEDMHEILSKPILHVKSSRKVLQASDIPTLDSTPIKGNEVNFGNI